MIVFVTGGIGAGKSTATRILSELGAETARADDFVHELLNRAEIQHEVASALGIPDASDRAAIAEIVFRDEQKRKTLEAIIHPRVAAEVRHRVAGMTTPLVYEVPLVPTPSQHDLVIVIDAPMALRMQRLVARGMSESDAQRRMAAQPSPEDYRRQADYVVDNSGSESALRARLNGIWEDVRRDARQL